jgi:hypothetical protein
MSTQEWSQASRRMPGQGMDEKLYAVLDGAAIPAMLTLFAQYKVRNVCLLPGELDPELAQVAPYLVELPPESTFAEQAIGTGVGSHWGIFAVSEADFRTLRMHLRKFLNVWDPDGKPLFFRFYDPRVLRVFLPTCSPDELRLLFGPVSAYYAENEAPGEPLRFEFSGDRLVVSRQTLSARSTFTTTEG